MQIYENDFRKFYENNMKCLYIFENKTQSM